MKTFIPEQMDSTRSKPAAGGHARTDTTADPHEALALALTQSPLLIAQRQRIESLAQSPRVVAQRRRIDSLHASVHPNKLANPPGASPVLQGAGLVAPARPVVHTPRQAALPLGAAVLQAKGSGGEKIGFEFRDNASKDENIAVGIQLVKSCWAEAKAARHDTKIQWMNHKMIGPVYKPNDSVTKTYAQALDQIAEEKVLFLEKLKPPLFHDAATNIITFNRPDMAEAVEIATLRIGDAAFAPNALEHGLRNTFHKKGMEDNKTQGGDAKEYIEDDLGVKTRRYAYIEKNFYQMMDFFKTERMTGRFQQYLQAGGMTAGPQTSTQKAREEVVRGGLDVPLTTTQIAVAHQELGSSPEQRGVSLASTEKVGGTVGNKKKNFRDQGGFRLKVDLAKVVDALLINHYSDKGLIAQTPVQLGVKGISMDTADPPKKPYLYGASVRKNRELYLEYLKPEWVVSIEYHDEGGYGSPLGETTPLNGLDSFRQAATTYEKYWSAFDLTLSGTPVNNPDGVETKGINSAREVIDGFRDGRSRTPPLATALAVHQELVGDNDLKDRYSQWHIGYMRGRLGKPNFSNSAEYALEMTKVHPAP